MGSRIHTLIRDKGQWQCHVPPVRSSDRLKLQAACQLLSERVHTVYTERFIRGPIVREMIQITMLVAVFVCAQEYIIN